MILMWYHPKYYKELAKKRKELEKQQADKPTSQQADEPTSEQASEELKSLQAYVKKTKKPI